jgi:hypothetical protein
MKAKWYVLAGLVLTGACLLALPASAEDPKPMEGTEAEKKADVVDDLAMAYRLAELGRKDKAPEYLITAAGLLRAVSKVKMKPITEKPEITADKDGKGDVVDKVNKAPDLKEEAENLFIEAEAMGKSLKLDLASLLKAAQSRDNTRDVFGGPRTISRVIGGHQTQVFRFDMVPRTPAAFGFHASIPLTIMVVRSDNNDVWSAGTLRDGKHRQIVPGSRTGVVPVTVRIRNEADVPADYTLWVN